jgi:hypothetical protein
MQSVLRRLSARRAQIVQLGSLLFALAFSGACKTSTSPCNADPKPYYGPPQCATDQGCVDQYGAGWYCDKDRIIDQECGVKWPTCAKR